MVTKSGYAPQNFQWDTESLDYLTKDTAFLTRLELSDSTPALYNFYLQSNLTTGQVNVYFNPIGGNFSQHYEYINNGSSVQESYIQLLDNANEFSYIRVQDVGSSPIFQATVWVRSTNNLPGS